MKKAVGIFLGALSLIFLSSLMIGDFAGRINLLFDGILFYELKDASENRPSGYMVTNTVWQNGKLIGYIFPGGQFRRIEAMDFSDEDFMISLMLRLLVGVTLLGLSIYLIYERTEKLNTRNLTKEKT